MSATQVQENNRYSNGEVYVSGVLITECNVDCECYNRRPNSTPDSILEDNDNALEKKSITNQGTKKLGILDKLLPIWILSAIIAGLLIGYFVPQFKFVLKRAEFDGVSLPVALGLIWMMIPVLSKVEYELVPKLLGSTGLLKQLGFSLVMNWILAPATMTLLAWLTLPDLPEYRTGIIMVGLARCIAMVLIWNDLAGGHPEFCAILVAVNSVLQIFLYGPLALLIIDVIPRAIGVEVPKEIGVDLWTIAKGVLVYLGIPLVLGVLVRYSLIGLKGKHWFIKKFLPKFGPTSLFGLLFTIIVLFAIQGENVIENPSQVARVSVPLLLYFIIVFFSTLLVCYLSKTSYDFAVTQSFTAASNNFELAIAVSIGAFGVESPQALGAVIGPLIEVPVLVALVYFCLFIKRCYCQYTES